MVKASRFCSLVLGVTAFLGACGLAAAQQPCPEGEVRRVSPRNPFTGECVCLGRMVRGADGRCACPRGTSGLLCFPDYSPRVLPCLHGRNPDGTCRPCPRGQSLIEGRCREGCPRGQKWHAKLGRCAGNFAPPRKARKNPRPPAR